MAKLVLTNAFVSLGGTNLSDHLQSVALKADVAIADATCMTQTWKDVLPGLKDWDLELSFAQDYAVSSVDATLWPLLGVSVAVVLRPDSAAKGVANPEFTGSGFIANYNPLDGKVGENKNMDCKISIKGAGALARATS